MLVPPCSAADVTPGVCRANQVHHANETTYARMLREEAQMDMRFSTVRPETGATAYTLRAIIQPHCQDTLDHIKYNPGISIFRYHSRYRNLRSLKYGALSRTGWINISFCQETG